MLEIFKTTDTGEFLHLEKIEKDCWVSLTAPSPRELQEVADLTGVELDALKAPLDEEERARIELEDNYHLIWLTPRKSRRRWWMMWNGSVTQPCRWQLLPQRISLSR